MSRSCAACGAANFRTLLADRIHRYSTSGETEVFRYSVIQCRECDLGMVDPEPSHEVLQTFYPADYGPYVPPAAEQIQPSWKYRVAGWRYAGESGRKIGQLHAALGIVVEIVTGKTVSFSLGLPLGLPHDAQIFELGFGSGGWLLAMRALGYKNLSGFDIAPNHKQLEAIQGAGVAVTTGDFLENKYPKGAYDCIRLEHVFEHVREPARVLEKLRNMLSPTGMLVMTMPCIDSLSGQLSLSHSPNGVEIPRHLYHYSPRSLSTLLQAAGFSNVRTLVYGDVVSLGSTIAGVLRERGVPGRVPTSALRSLGPAYKIVCDTLRKGELLTAVATR